MRQIKTPFVEKRVLNIVNQRGGVFFDLKHQINELFDIYFFYT